MRTESVGSVSAFQVPITEWERECMQSFFLTNAGMNGGVEVSGQVAF